MMYKISFLLKYPNSHLTPIIHHFMKFPYSNTVYYINDINEERKGFDWEIPPNINPIKIKKIGHYVSVLKSDIIISWGLWMDWRFLLLTMIASILNKTIIVLSESENQYRLKRRNTFLKYITSIPFRKKKVYFLTMGGYKTVVKDFSKYGFKKRNFFPFGFCGALHSSYREESSKLDVSHNKKLRILYVGQLIHRKGLDILLNALNNLDKSKYFLQVAGEGVMKNELIEMAKTLGISNNVVFLGQQSTEDLKFLYKHSDVLVIPSRFDGWGAVLNEAASFSLPLIASINVRGGEELIETYRNGFVFKDEKELKRIFEFILNNPLILEQFREASKEISSFFSPDNLANKLNIYLNRINKIK